MEEAAEDTEVSVACTVEAAADTAEEAADTAEEEAVMMIILTEGEKIIITALSSRTLPTVEGFKATVFTSSEIPEIGIYILFFGYICKPWP